VLQRFLLRWLDSSMDTLKIKIGDKWLEVDVLEFSLEGAVFLVDGERMTVTPSVVRQAQRPGEYSSSYDTNSDSSKSFTAPMPGTVIEILVEVGDHINIGDEVCILESMKMQQVLRSEVSGTVRSIEVSEGDQILDGHIIFDLKS